MANSKTLVLFDFDGTITNKDSFLELIKFQKGDANFYAGFAQLSPLLLFFKAGIINAQYMKEKVMTFFWKNIEVEAFKSLCIKFNETALPKMIRSEALTQLKDHQEKGHEVAVVSASAEEWIKPFCDQHSIKCIASRLEKEQGKITGKIKGVNCNGDEKARRIKENFMLNDYGQIIAYGDSKGDKAMFQLASVSHYKPFR